MLFNSFGFILDTAATLFAAAFLLRFWTQAVRVRPPDTIGRFTLKLSNWLVLPLRRILPGFGGYDWASLLGAILVAVLSVAASLSMAANFSTQLLLLLSAHQLLSWIIYGFMGLLLLEAIFSWVNPYAPLAPFVRALNEPFLRPLRHIIPPIGGLDLSVLAALILLRISLQLAGAAVASLL